MGENRISASGVSPKLVISRRRRQREKRVKVNDYYGQYVYTPEPKCKLEFSKLYNWNMTLLGPDGQMFIIYCKTIYVCKAFEMFVTHLIFS